MSNQNKKAEQDRRRRMNRTDARVISAGKGELLHKKQQDRLARQEQKMAEKLERQETKRPAKPRKPSSAGGTKPLSGKRASGSSGNGVKTLWQNLKQTTSKKSTKENGFQVILGGKSQKVLRWVGVVAVVAVIAVIINSMVPIGMVEYVQNMFAGAGSGEGFPVSISASSSRNIISVGSDVALLGDSSLYLYKSNGKLLFERQHGFASPAVAACSARVMIYDRGGKGLRIENRAKTVYTMDLDQVITTACMADNGYFAVVTRGSNYISDVNVYNASAEEKFVWHSAKRQVMGVALSDNGRYLAIHTFGVEAAQGVTDIILYDTKKNVILTEKSIPGSTPVSLEFKGSQVVSLLSDRAVSLNRDGESKEYLYAGGTLRCFDNTNDFGAVLILGMHQNDRNTKMVVLDKELEVLGETVLNQEILSVSAKGKKVQLLADQSVLFMNRYGEANGEAVLQADAKMLLCKGSRAIVLGAETLDEVYAD